MATPLKTLFLNELAERHDAELQMALAMPKMIRAATCPHLVTLIKTHLRETEDHIKALERMMDSLSMKTPSRKCEIMFSMIAKLDQTTQDFAGSPAINAALVSIFQKMEHLEIVSYGCLREWAESLGMRKNADSLEWILDAEKCANQSLIELARSRSNSQATTQSRKGNARNPAFMS